MHMSSNGDKTEFSAIGMSCECACPRTNRGELPNFASPQSWLWAAFAGAQFPVPRRWLASALITVHGRDAPAPRSVRQSSDRALTLQLLLASQLPAVRPQPDSAACNRNTFMSNSVAHSPPSPHSTVAQHRTHRARTTDAVAAACRLLRTTLTLNGFLLSLCAFKQIGIRPVFEVMPAGGNAASYRSACDPVHDTQEG